MDVLYTVRSCSYITVTCIHWYTCIYYFYIDHFSYYMDYCYMYITVFPLHDCFPLLILIFPLLDMSVVDMWCVELSATWIQVMGPTSRISHLLFLIILFHAINRAYAMLSCYMYQALYLFLIYCVVKDNKDNLGMGRLDSWLDLIGWMYWIYIYPTAGDGNAGYRLYIAPWALVSRFLLPLSGGPLSQQPEVCLRQWSRVCMWYTYSIRAPWPLGFQLT